MQFSIFDNGHRRRKETLLQQGRLYQAGIQGLPMRKNLLPKCVMSLDEFDFSKDGITHLNVEDFLLGKADIRVN